MKADTRETDFAASSALERTSTHFINKKVWLPLAVYNALPYFYLVAGIAALIATIHVGSWYWVIPHTVLFAAVCIHIAILILRRRHQLPVTVRQRQSRH